MSDLNTCPVCRKYMTLLNTHDSFTDQGLNRRERTWGCPDQECKTNVIHIDETVFKPLDSITLNFKYGSS